MHGLRVVMIASAVPGEGKTLTATNLALTLSESYQAPVLLIDADLRKPALHDVFRLEHGDRPDRWPRADAAKRSSCLRQVSSRSADPARRPADDRPDGGAHV